MTLFRNFAAVAGLAAVLAAAGCAGDEAASGAPASAGPPPVPVTTAAVVRKSMPLELRVIGSAEAYSTVAIRSQITGQLTAVNFRERSEEHTSELQSRLQ